MKESDPMKTVLIVGAGRGLGLCLTRCHLQCGDLVFALYRTPTAELTDLAAHDPHLTLFHCDVTSDDSVKQALAQVRADTASLDVLYHSAGLFTFAGRVGLAQTDVETCRKLFDVNALGPLRVCQAALPLLRSGSTVILISSQAGSIGDSTRTGEYGYCMSKAGLNMFGKILSNELQRQRCCVLCVNPGWMRTAMGGPAALSSPRAVEPEVSAKNIMTLAEKIQTIPPSCIYLNHTGEPLPW